MSEVKLNIFDARDAIHGTTHGAVADAVIAALSAEPETIAELEAAVDRFIKRLDDRRPFDSFSSGEDFEPWDAGLVIVDLAVRIVVSGSSYSAPQARGRVQYHDGTQATDLWLPYCLPDDWLFVYSLDEYKSARDERGGAGFSLCLHRVEPASAQTEVCATPLDAREVLYGTAMLEFIVSECYSLGAFAELGESARNRSGPQSSILDPQSSISICGSARNSSDPQLIHSRWLMTPRAGLRGKTPRDVIVEKLRFIDSDLQTRAEQWSLLGEGPPPLSRDSHAYRFGGFGTHEYVIYYYLLRHLLTACLERVNGDERADIAPEIALQRLDEMKQVWLNEPNEEFDGRVPSAIIESERRRVPMMMSAKQMMIDENCDLCRLMAGETGEDFGPGFWHLDGCNMDQDFEFSTYRTREEWEAEQRRWREFNEEFERNWAAEHGNVADEHPGKNDEG